MRVGQPNWTWASMCSTACWNWDARPTSALPEPRRGRGHCACIPDPCNTAPPAPSRLGHARGARRVSKKLATVVAEARAKHPDKAVEVWATGEHRIGLKPILRRVWAPKGHRPIALGHHRYKWLYVTAFVQPTSGEVFWYIYISNGVS